MGSVTTWYTFINCLDQFRYFMPMSGAMDYEGDNVDAAVTASGYSSEDFFIYAMTGTNDFECDHFTRQIEGMLSMPSGNFVASDNEANGNLAFRLKEGYAHDGAAAMEYTYNVLLWFWNSGQTQSTQSTDDNYSRDTKISDVVNDPAFGDYGRLIFRYVNTGYYSGDTLGSLQLTWYNDIDPDKTVEIANYMKENAAAGEPIFMISTQRKKKQRIQPRKILDCSSSKENPVRDLLSVMLAVVSPMWERCMTVSHTLWSYPRKDTTPLH